MTDHRNTQRPISRMKSTEEIIIQPPKVEEVIRPVSVASVGLTAVEIAEDLSDFSDDVDEILNRDEEEPLAAAIPAESQQEIAVSEASNRTPVRASSELAVGPESTSGPMSVTDGEDLLGGMEIEQISDEELEDESNKTGIINKILIKILLELIPFLIQ